MLTKTNKLLIKIHQTTIAILINQILFINQIIFNLTHEVNKHDNQDNPFLKDKTQHHTIIIFNHNLLCFYNTTNQIKWKMKFHNHFVYNNMKSQRPNLQFFSNTKYSRITPNDYESIPYG